MLSKFVSLTFRNSLNAFTKMLLPSCELLSKFVSLTFRNSFTIKDNVSFGVVNCFQNLYLWRLETAWLIYLFRHISCELLSKFVSLTFRNSALLAALLLSPVVNCFQNLYLWRLETAFSSSTIVAITLWIAFKICIFDV